MKLVLGCFLSFLSLCANANQVVLFINGGLDNDEQIVENVTAFVGSMVGHGVPASTDFRYFPIPQSVFQAFESLNCQRELSTEAFPTRGVSPSPAEYTQYYKSLGTSYVNFLASATSNLISCSGILSGDPQLARVARTTKALADAVAGILKGNSVVLVGHSQGAAYADAAVALLFARGDISSLDDVKVVGIASVAFTSLGARYVNASQDTLNYSSGSHWQSPYSLLIRKMSQPREPAAWGMELPERRRGPAAAGWIAG